MAKDRPRRSPPGGGARSGRAPAPDRDGTAAAGAGTSRRSTGGRSAASGRGWVLAAGVAVVILVVAGGGLAMAMRQPATSATAGGAPNGTVIQANGGHWTNITPDTLAAMMSHKDFTLLNVKTPYVGEIQGTDLYIPYDQLAARAAQLPADKSARLVVYCRTGHESAIAAQTLLDLGYTDIENLDGGMTAWTASGRPLVQLARS